MTHSSALTVPDVDSADSADLNGAGSTGRLRRRQQLDTYSKVLGKHKEHESLDGRQEWK